MAFSCDEPRHGHYETSGVSKKRHRRRCASSVEHQGSRDLVPARPTCPLYNLMPGGPSPGGPRNDEPSSPCLAGSSAVALLSQPPFWPALAGQALATRARAWRSRAWRALARRALAERPCEWQPCLQEDLTNCPPPICFKFSGVQGEGKGWVFGQ